MNSSKSDKLLLNKTTKQNTTMRWYAMVTITLLLPIGVISTMIWLNNSATRTTHFLIQDAYGLVADNGRTVPKAYFVYGNQRYEMTPFVHFDGKNMNKLIYPSADVTPVLTVKEGGKIGTEFSENPVSVKAYIAD